MENKLFETILGILNDFGSAILVFERSVDVAIHTVFESKPFPQLMIKFYEDYPQQLCCYATCVK